MRQLLVQYIDKGFDFAENFILKIWDHYIYDKNINIIDAKTKLQEYSLKKFKILPTYKFIQIQVLNTDQILKLLLNCQTLFVEAEEPQKN